MTVAELIEELRKLPADMPVLVYDDCYGFLPPELEVTSMTLRGEETVQAIPGRSQNVFDALTL